MDQFQCSLRNRLHDHVLLGLPVRAPGTFCRPNSQNHAGKVHRLGQGRADRRLSRGNKRSSAKKQFFKTRNISSNSFLSLLINTVTKLHFSLLFTSTRKHEANATYRYEHYHLRLILSLFHLYHSQINYLYIELLIIRKNSQ